jgi:hypothetical protein
MQFVAPLVRLAMDGSSTGVAEPGKECVDRLAAHSLKTRCRTTVCSLMYDTDVRSAPRSDAAGAFFLL